MKSQSDVENHKKSRIIAEKVYCRDMSRQMPNIAICRGKRQLSRFRTHRDKLLPLLSSKHLTLLYLVFKAERDVQILLTICSRVVMDYMLLRADHPEFYITSQIA